MVTQVWPLGVCEQKELECVQKFVVSDTGMLGQTHPRIQKYTTHTPQGLVDVWPNPPLNSLHVSVMKADCVFAKSKLGLPSFQVKVKYLSCCLGPVIVYCTMVLCLIYVPRVYFLYFREGG